MQFLLQRPCVKCGETDPVLLEFNHLDGATKTANICDVIHFRVSLARIHVEIAKCEVLCANCHQRHTMTERLVHYKLTLAQDGQSEFVSARMAADRRNIRIVLDCLNSAACVACGLADQLVLQFDHLESKTKDIASFVRSHSKSLRLIAELIEVRDTACELPSGVARQLNEVGSEVGHDPKPRAAAPPQNRTVVRGIYQALNT